MLWCHRRPAATPPAPTSQSGTVEFGHNGCTTRDDILRRNLSGLVVRPGTCFAQSGTLHDPSVQIDHVVSLSDAWYAGARDWTTSGAETLPTIPETRSRSTEGRTSDKAFRDAASWLPSNAAFRCDFVARVVVVKSAYGLSVSAKEKRAIVAAWLAVECRPPVKREDRVQPARAVG